MTNTAGYEHIYNEHTSALPYFVGAPLLRRLSLFIWFPLCCNTLFQAGIEEVTGSGSQCGISLKIRQCLLFPISVTVCWHILLSRPSIFACSCQYGLNGQRGQMCGALRHLLHKAFHKLSFRERVHSHLERVAELGINT